MSRPGQVLDEGESWRALEFVEKPSGGAVRRWKTTRNAHLLPCKLRFLLSASLRFSQRASLRLFEIVPDDFIAVFRLARHPPERFSTNC
jgi:hypothetical protein